MMDDILVYGKNQYEQDERLEVVMRRLEKAGMTLNRNNCVFSKKEVTCLGPKVSDKGIALDPAKGKAITKMGEPINRKHLKSFIEIVNYLSKFSPKLAKLERPLREFTKANPTWVWDRDQERSFESIKFSN